MTDATPRPRPPAGSAAPTSMPLWPWLIAPALTLALIIGASLCCLLLVHRERGPVVPQPEPDAPAVSIAAPAAATPPPTEADDSAPGPRNVEKVDPPPAAVAPLFPTRRPQPPPDLELAANAPAGGRALGLTVAELPRLSESLLLTPPAETASKEIPRATREREALYDRVIDRFILYDVGRLRGLEGRKAALDFDALGPDAIPALVRGLNRSATLDASCPVMAISARLGPMLRACTDLELLAQARDGIGQGVGPTPYHAYLTGLKRACDERLKKAADLLKPRVPHLVAVLKSKDAATRRKAANTLGLVGAEAQAAVPALVEALKDPDPQVGGCAARALAAIGPPAVPALLKAAESAPDPRVRTLALLALGESRPVDDATTRALIAALKDPEKEVRGAAAFALARLGDGAVPPLRQALKAKDPGAALALAEVGPPAVSAAVPDLVAALSDDDRELRVAAHHALVRIGSPAVPALAAELTAADLRGWYSISVALGKIGPDARAAVPALTKGLAHDEKGVRILATNALAKIEPGNPVIKPVLGEAVPALVEVLGQRDGALRAWAAVSLGSIGPDARSAVPALTLALTDTDDAVRTAARGALARLGKAAVPALIESFKDGGEEVRAGSIESLGRIGADAVPELVTATRAVDDRVRRGAVAALAKVGPAGSAAAPALVEALKDRDREVRLGAARALGAIRPEKSAAAEALLQRLHDPDEEFRGACREALASIGPGAVGPLTAALKATDAATRRAAADLLRKIGGEARAGVPALCAAAKDDDARVRAAALAALRDVLAIPAEGGLDATGEAGRQALAGGLGDADEEVRIAAHLGLIRLGRTAAPALSAALNEKEPAVRRLAAETLKKLGPDALAAAPDLVAALRDADAEVRDGAAWALEAIDPELREAVPALRRTLAEPPKITTTNRPAREPRYWTVGELAAVAAGEPGDPMKQSLRELSLRRGEQALLALGRAAVSEDREVRTLGREMLLKCLTGRPDDKAEQEALRRLKLARRLLEDGARDQAKDSLRSFIKAHPRTRAAEEARRLLVEAEK